MTILWLILWLLAGGAIAGFSERIHRNAPRWVSLAVIFVAFVLLWNIPVDTVEKAAWIPRFGISVILAMDGLSYALVALNLFLGIVAVVSSWGEIERNQGFFQFNVLWTLAGVAGVFTALDLFLFFVFWEVMLVPMYFLIAIWGHEARAYAAMKFFLFTQISGLLLLFAILALVYVNYAATGVITFSYKALLGAAIDPTVAFYLMLGFFVAFVVKLPGVPFHTWLPDAHTQAPTAGSVLLAGILLKTGAYGLLRFVVPLFPEAALEFREPAMLLGAVSVVYGGYLAYSQSDFKRLVAYSSISHMGFRAARGIRLEPHGGTGRGGADGGARLFHGGAVHDGRSTAAAAAHPGDGRDGRPLGARAAHGRRDHVLRDRLARHAGAG